MDERPNEHTRFIGGGGTALVTATEKLPIKYAVKQCIAACIAHALVIHAGINMSFSAVLLPQLYDKKSTIQIDKSEASWIASIVAIALPIGSVLIGPLMDRWGRKRCSLLVGATFIIAWLMHAGAKNVWYLYIGRTLAGIGGGLSTVAMVYVSEIAHPTYRTALLSLTSVFVSFGILLICVFGLWFTWRTISILSCIIMIINMITIWFLPESPPWCIVFKNNTIKAGKALKWLYPNDEIYQKQYKILTENHGKDKNLIQSTKSSIIKPFMILLIIFIFQQLSGVYVIIFYAVDLFRKVGGQFEKGIDEFFALILLGTIRFVTALICALISTKIGRRPLFLVSGIGMCVTSFIVGLYMYLTTIPETLSGITHDDNIPIICILGYVCFGSIGYMVIPWTLIGELLPIRVRAKLAGVMISLAYIMMFATVKIFPFILDLIKIQSLFMYMAIINLIACCFIYVFLPETLGKSSMEIERYFKKI